MNCQEIGLVGHPLGHTMSPFIHEKLFDLSGIEYSYEIFDISELFSSIKKLKNLDGFNITIPHKENIIKFLDSMDRQSQLCGSVNTVACRGGKMHGYTTDGAGCIKSLQDSGADIGGEILVLGNGGAARALGFAFAALNSTKSITLACRPGSRKAQKLKNDLADFAGEKGIGVKLLTYDELEQNREKYDLLLNATSVGMSPKAEASPVRGDTVCRCRLVFDAVYNPIDTQLIKIAEKYGIKTVRGMGMLVYQAAVAHEIWYGGSFKAEDLLQLCRQAELEMVNRQVREDNGK